MPKHLQRPRRTVAIVAIVTAWVLASAPTAVAANATGKNIILPKAGIITGHVLSDTNGAGIVGAYVSAQPASFTGSPSSGSAATTAGGAFSIKGLTVGKTYIVSVSPNDDVHYGGWWTNANADQFTPSYGSAVATPTATAAGRNIGNIRVPKGFVISGTVRGGTVASNVTLNGIGVDLSGDDYDSTVTANGGKYRFGGLPPGTYNLAFETASTVNYKDGVYKSNGGTNWANENTVPTNIVITTANLTRNIILPTGRTVTGHVKTLTGGALANAYVSINGSNGDESVVTNATGTYVLRGLADGTGYEIRVDAPYPQTRQSGYYNSGAASHFTPDDAMASAITVNGNETIADIKLPTGYTITGQVFLPNGTTAASGAGVSAASSDGYGYASTGADGKFTIKGLEPGTFKVQVGVPSGQNAYGGWVDGATPTHRLSLNSAAADSFVLNTTTTTRSAGKLVLWTGWTIAGTIWGGTTASKVALPGAYATAFGPGYGFAVANASGAYKVIGLPPGEYMISFYAGTNTAYERGYWKSGALPNYTREYSMAGLVCIGPTVPCP